MRAKQTSQPQDRIPDGDGQPAALSPGIRRSRMRWAQLTRGVYEVDPLPCPNCGAPMTIIAFIERRDQAATVERILRHCGLCILA